MSLVDLLRQSWTVLGLEAPRFAWLAVLVLPSWTLLALGRLAWHVAREARVVGKLARQLEALRRTHGPPTGQGLPAAGLAALRRIFEATPGLLASWQELETQLFETSRPAGGGPEGTWTLRSAEEAFGEGMPGMSRLNRDFYQAFSGMITGLGLLVTFAAILVALLDVRIDGNRVQGLETLIHGLSGKFVSSVAALASASVFLMVEKPLTHALEMRRRRLIRALDGVLPPLSPLPLLAATHAAVAEQSASLRRFTEDAAGLLTGMRGEVAATQHAVRELVGAARRTTEEQAALGRAHLAELTTLVRQVTQDTHHTASVTIAELGTALAGAVQELTVRVGSLQDDLARRVADGAERSAAVVRTVLGEAERWAADSHARLGTLLERHGTHVARMDTLQGGLDGLLDRVQSSLGHYAALAVRIDGVARQLSEAAGSVGSAAAAMSGAATEAGRAAAASAAVVERLAETGQAQASTWERVQEGVSRYQEVFATVEGHASELLTQIGQNLASYTETTRRSLSEAIGLSHDYLADATQRLRASIDDLDEHLQSLRMTLDEALPRSRARVS